MQFLIDECLTVSLVDVAVRNGWRAAHVARIGRSGAKDWALMSLILDEDWTFVTRNAVDFRGRRNNALPGGLYAGVVLHAGLICLTGTPLDAKDQIELFEAVLTALGGSDPINKRLEARIDVADIAVDIFDMP